PVTCLVEGASEHAFSQIMTLYLPENFRRPDMIESSARLARSLERSLLLANDSTADPYSFVLVSKTGALSVVSADPAEWDENGRYLIATRE
uniref:hypothetical protein n=1 Tax=Klebsiella aerogenes TaxID=548 RepID=UPI0013D5F2E0